MSDPSRRNLLRAALVLPALALPALGLPAPALPAPAPAALEAAAALADLERRAGGRLGVAAWRRDGAKVVAWRADERFPFCSTGKVMVAGAVLALAARDGSLLARRIRYARSDLVTYSPRTGQHLADGMTVAELCAAALQFSDNSACNFLLDQAGGPAGVTAFARRIGDTAFRLDRRETALNTAIPGDERDTTTPRAMAASLEALLFGEALAPDARRQLLDWMLGNTTGAERIAAGMPPGWRTADKTGTGDYGSTNDVGAVLPPSGEPLLVAIYYTGRAQDAAADSKTVAAAAAIVAGALA